MVTFGSLRNVLYRSNRNQCALFFMFMGQTCLLTAYHWSAISSLSTDKTKIDACELNLLNEERETATDNNCR